MKQTICFHLSVGAACLIFVRHVFFEKTGIFCKTAKSEKLMGTKQLLRFFRKRER